MLGRKKEIVGQMAGPYDAYLITKRNLIKIIFFQSTALAPIDIPQGSTSEDPHEQFGNNTTIGKGINCRELILAEQCLSHTVARGEGQESEVALVDSSVIL